MDERYLKDMAAKEAAGAANQCATGTIGGLYGSNLTQSAQPSMRERINAQLYRAQVESRKENALAELQYLLDKNPEVARILDLLEQVGR